MQKKNAVTDTLPIAAFSPTAFNFLLPKA